jgi:predicted DNA-binding transcriptional regulator AlpA
MPATRTHGPASDYTPRDTAAARRRRGALRGTPDPAPENSWLTVDQLCAELHIARSTFYDWRAKGRAPKCHKLPNGDIRIRRTDYERWLADLGDAA